MKRIKSNVKVNNKKKAHNVKRKMDSIRPLIE